MDPMEARLRFLGALAGIALFMVALIWGFWALVAAGSDFSSWCEDTSGPCFQPKPVSGTVEAVTALIGIGAVVLAGARFIRYARKGKRPTGLIPVVAVVAVAFAAWLFVASDSYGWHGLWH